MKAATRAGQTNITDYFDVKSLSDSVDNEPVLKSENNRMCDQTPSASVAPLLERLYESAKKITKDCVKMLTVMIKQ